MATKEPTEVEVGRKSLRNSQFRDPCFASSLLGQPFQSHESRKGAWDMEVEGVFEFGSEGSGFRSTPEKEEDGYLCYGQGWLKEKYGGQ